MTRAFLTSAIFALAAVTLGACGNKDEAPTAPEAEAVAPPPSEKVEKAVRPLEAGDHCYFRKDENITEAVEIAVTPEGGVSGTNYGMIHQEAAGYFASFSTALNSGSIGEGDEVMFDTVTEVDGDTQTGTALWHLSEGEAAPDGLETSLLSVSCDGLQDDVYPPQPE